MANITEVKIMKTRKGMLREFRKRFQGHQEWTPTYGTLRLSGADFVQENGLRLFGCPQDLDKCLCGNCRTDRDGQLYFYAPPMRVKITDVLLDERLRFLTA